MHLLRSLSSSGALLLVSAAALLSGCSGNDDGLNFDAQPDAGIDQDADAFGDGAGGGGGNDGETGPCKSALDCDDGIACTIDVCVNGVCSHYAGPDEGGTACPFGQYCEVEKGCVPGIACADDEQCKERFGGDACKANIACDPGPSICTFTTLDKDNDGRVPLVCGGDDCNDADNGIHGMHPEICDGKDNDCNGSIDDDAICPGAAVCQSGACVCPPVNQCGDECVDKNTDPKHCGACNRACGGELACEGGECVCPATAVTCDGVCVNTDTSFRHCGGCNKSCQAGQMCESGKCVQAPCQAPGLLIVQDQSGSMAGPKWTAAVDGINAFLASSEASGLQAGIGFFPSSSFAVECQVSTYETPSVGIAPLSSNRSAIQAALSRNPNGGSILSAPLEGSARYVSTWASANPQSGAAVVVIFDGEPNGCTASGDSLDNAKTIASNALSASPSVKTFVIGIGGEVTQARLDLLSQAGGTGSAHRVTTAAEMTNALEQIRDSLSCL